MLLCCHCYVSHVVKLSLLCITSLAIVYGKSTQCTGHSFRYNWREIFLSLIQAKLINLQMRFNKLSFLCNFILDFGIER